MFAPVEIEQLALNAWPARQTYLHSGMAVRWADGYTKRANSATILFDASWSADKQQWVEDFYRNRGLPSIFRLLSFTDPKIFDSNLEANGYEKLDLTHVMSAEINPSFEIDGRCQIVGLAEWLAVFHELEKSKLGVEKRRRHQAILEQIPGTICPMVLNIDQEPAACGLGVCDGGAIGLFDIVTGENFRRRGLGTAVVQSLLAWGKTEGAQVGFLQVLAKNESAQRIYVKSEFKILYNYWYRAKAS